jgi:hypothetical protein
MNNIDTTTEIAMIKNRINILKTRNPVANENIIRKLKRKLRKLEEN